MTTIASRGRRLAAALIDVLILAVPLALIQGDRLPEEINVVLAFLTPVLATYQLVMLTRTGQTAGKRALRLRIVRQDTGENGGFKTNVLLRVFVQSLLCLIPGYLVLDTLFIFRADRRCLHDMIAATRVVDAVDQE